MASETWFQRLRRWGVDDLLAAYGGLKLVPVSDDPVKVSGLLAFEASARNRETINDEYGIEIVSNPVHVHDYHATILHLLGLDHTRLTYRYGGRDFRLTDVAGSVLQDIFV